MRKNYRRNYKRSSQPTYNIIINKQASRYSSNAIENIRKRLKEAGAKYFFSEPESVGEAIQTTKKILTKQPTGIIVCGGDGTVNQIARLLIRRTTPLGIVPMGRFNNIYNSLYETSGVNEAIDRILAGATRKIDYAMAGQMFFLGSMALGLIPEMADTLQTKRSPRFAIGWSRLAAQAAANVRPVDMLIKVDAFAFNMNPQTVTINLLKNCLGLPITPASAPDDGKYEVTFDTGRDKATMSSYIRQLFKEKFLYSDDIRMFRGERVSLAPMSRTTIYLDGELVDINMPEMNIEIHPQRIKVFDNIDRNEN